VSLSNSVSLSVPLCLSVSLPLTLFLSLSVSHPVISQLEIVIGCSPLEVCLDLLGDSVPGLLTQTGCQTVLQTGSPLQEAAEDAAGLRGVLPAAQALAAGSQAAKGRMGQQRPLQQGDCLLPVVLVVFPQPPGVQQVVGLLEQRLRAQGLPLVVEQPGCRMTTPGAEHQQKQQNFHSRQRLDTSHSAQREGEEGEGLGKGNGWDGKDWEKEMGGREGEAGKRERDKERDTGIVIERDIERERQMV